jgi:molybdopterin molybdotransferase
MQVSFEEAQALVLASTPAPAVESIALELARGRVLGTDAIASDDLVPFARSAMDGFAVRAADTGFAPRALRLAASPIAAGSAVAHALAAGEAAAIATGAPLPPGADAVVPFERARRENGTVHLSASVVPGQHVFPPGDDARRGDRLARAGERLTPALCALLASAGHARVHVSARVRAAVFCTGDELIGVAEEPGFGQVRNSNLALVCGLLEEAGALVSARRTLPDDPALLRSAFAQALDEVDLIVTTGGASVGERDFVKATFGELGVRFDFDSVAMRPGRPTAFGTRGACAVAVLPGNPSAVFVAFVELVRLSLARRHGLAAQRLARISARLRGELHAKAGRVYLPFARLTFDGAGAEAAIAANQCSALNRNAAQTHALAIVPPGDRSYRTGEPIELDVFAWP